MGPYWIPGSALIMTVDHRRAALAANHAVWEAWMTRRDTYFRELPAEFGEIPMMFALTATR